MAMETLSRDVPSSVQHHNNSSVSNMKHSYVQVGTYLLLQSFTQIILIHPFHVYNFLSCYQLSKTCLDEDAQINKKLPKELLLRYNLNLLFVGHSKT